VVMFVFLGWVLVSRRLRVVSLDIHAELDDPALVPTVEIDPAL